MKSLLKISPVWIKWISVAEKERTQFIPLPIFFWPFHTVVSLPYYPIHLKEKIISKLIQKSKVVYLRCQKVGQYCKPYLKYWPQGVNDPLEPSGGQKIQWFIKWKGLLVSGGVYNRVQINSILKINILNPFTYSLRDQKIFFGILLCAGPLKQVKCY